MTNKQDFIAAIAPHAQEVERKYGVPASLVIAQAALESGWGSQVKGNNYFGIKTGSSWNGATQHIGTHEVVNGKRVAISDHFRAYDTLADSVENYGKFLAEHTRYAVVVNAANAHVAADALQRAGYATDPKYAALLKNIINKNRLTRFDDTKYQNYEATEEFDHSRKKLEEQRQNNPDVWNNFMGTLLTKIGEMLKGIFSLFQGSKTIATADQNSIERSNVPQKNVSVLSK